MNTKIIRVLGLALLTASTQVRAQSYTLTDIGAWDASGINDAGQVVGTDSVNQYAQVWTNGTLATFPPASRGYAINNSGVAVGDMYGSGTSQAVVFGPVFLAGASPASAVAINDGGVIVGSITNHSPGGIGQFGSSWSDASGCLSGSSCIQTLLYGIGSDPTLGVYVESSASAINNSGQVAGGSGGVATIWNGSTPTALGSASGYTNSYAEAINDAGIVVGYSTVPDPYVSSSIATVWNGTSVNSLPLLPGTVLSDAHAINKAGLIVGESSGNATNQRWATLWEGGKAYDLNMLVSVGVLPANVTLISALGINNNGQILVNSFDSQTTISEVYVLTPTSLPTTTPHVTGTTGHNGWYVSPTTISWTVTGNPTPITSGCATVSVSDTKGTTYTCTATNSLGTASQSVTIKQDTVAPQVTIKSPLRGTTYRLNAIVSASYICLDATSGVAKCSGTVPNSANIPTSIAGTYTFTVRSMDHAGNPRTKSILYAVK